MSEFSDWPLSNWIIIYVGRVLEAFIWFAISIGLIIFSVFKAMFKISIGNKLWIRLFAIMMGGVGVGAIIVIIPETIFDFLNFESFILEAVGLGCVSMLAIILSSTFFSSLRV